MQRIIDAPDRETLAGKMHHALLYTLATCGMRISEAVNLKVTDIQVGTDENNTTGWMVYVLGKNMTQPEARALSKQAKQAIDTWLAVRQQAGIESEYIFTIFAGRGD